VDNGAGELVVGVEAGAGCPSERPRTATTVGIALGTVGLGGLATTVEVETVEALDVGSADVIVGTWLSAKLALARFASGDEAAETAGVSAAVVFEESGVAEREA
jgi:hypothetical protein